MWRVSNANCAVSHHGAGQSLERRHAAGSRGGVAQHPTCLMCRCSLRPARCAALPRVGRRCGIVPLLETAEALQSWTIGPARRMAEFMWGLNDLQYRLACTSCRPRARVWWTGAAVARRHSLGLGSAVLPGWTKACSGARCMAEHHAPGLGAVILSRTFHRSEAGSFEEESMVGARQKAHWQPARSSRWKPIAPHRHDRTGGAGW